MKKFNFKLDPLLEHRQRLEDIRRKDLAEAGRLLEIEELKYKELRGKHRESIEEVERLKGEDNSSDELMLYYNYLIGLKDYMEEQALMVAKSRKVFEKQRVKLVSSAQDRRVVEIVKEKAHNLHLSEASKEEQKIIDDIATTRFIRKGKVL